MINPDDYNTELDEIHKSKRYKTLSKYDKEHLLIFICENCFSSIDIEQAMKSAEFLILQYQSMQVLRQEDSLDIHTIKGRVEWMKLIEKQNEITKKINKNLGI